MVSTLDLCRTVAEHTGQNIIGNTCIVRTDKSPNGEIRVDLPQKTVHTVPISLGPLERELYTQVDELFVDANVLARLMRQRQGE